MSSNDAAAGAGAAAFFPVATGVVACATVAGAGAAALLATVAAAGVVVVVAGRSPVAHKTEGEGKDCSGDWREMEMPRRAQGGQLWECALMDNFVSKRGKFPPSATCQRPCMHVYDRQLPT
jgi:hypothetical protein